MSDDRDTSPEISPEDRAERQRAVDFARGSVRYEGFVLSPEVEEIAARHIDGELTVDEFVAAIQALYKSGEGTGDV
ncbi:antitoxin VbhA family protein [Sphingomonas sp. PAMC 26605]|uniref:antitoxin VbhA family protein n=1 Tax=Sphingomonas sp. PAMC 26605 TaxID=1112214 RepID=UPI00026CDE5F|nr:antitoxin VbhA family protein [Sphingomonas sp. PAMC 26605]